MKYDAKPHNAMIYLMKMKKERYIVSIGPIKTKLWTVNGRNVLKDTYKKYLKSLDIF